MRQLVVAAVLVFVAAACLSLVMAAGRHTRVIQTYNLTTGHAHAVKVTAADCREGSKHWLGMAACSWLPHQLP